jgi:hypothetical protein
MLVLNPAIALIEEIELSIRGIDRSLLAYRSLSVSAYRAWGRFASQSFSSSSSKVVRRPSALNWSAGLEGSRFAAWRQDLANLGPGVRYYRKMG